MVRKCWGQDGHCSISNVSAWCARMHLSPTATEEQQVCMHASTRLVAVFVLKSHALHVVVSPYSCLCLLQRPSCPSSSVDLDWCFLTNGVFKLCHSGSGGWYSVHKTLSSSGTMGFSWILYRSFKDLHNNSDNFESFCGPACNWWWWWWWWWCWCWWWRQFSRLGHLCSSSSSSSVWRRQVMLSSQEQLPTRICLSHSHRLSHPFRHVRMHTLWSYRAMISYGVGLPALEFSQWLITSWTTTRIDPSHPPR